MPIFGLVQAAAAGPLIASGMPATQALVAALSSAMPTIVVIVIVLTIILLVIGLFLKPLKQEPTDATESYDSH